MQKKQYMRAVKAKLTYIKHMKKENATVDHQVRRSFLEIVCIQIVNEDYKRLEETMTQFAEDCGSNVYQQDEYLIASSLKEAVEERDFMKVLAITKKPIFSFLENEIVRQLKQTALNAP